MSKLHFRTLLVQVVDGLLEGQGFNLYSQKTWQHLFEFLSSKEWFTTNLWDLIQGMVLQLPSLPIPLKRALTSGCRILESYRARTRSCQCTLNPNTTPLWEQLSWLPRQLASAKMSCRALPTVLALSLSVPCRLLSREEKKTQESEGKMTYQSLQDIQSSTDTGICHQAAMTSVYCALPSQQR